jgi:hypothetical protein
MMIHVSGLNSLSEHEAAGGKYEVERPRICPSCGKSDCFWKHSTYSRTACEGELTAKVKIQRFICKYCSLVISCLFSFLIAYRRYTASLVGQCIEAYGAQANSYRKVAENKCGDMGFRSSVYRWTKLLSVRAGRLLLLVQKECILMGRRWEELATVSEQRDCPNGWKAKSEKKGHQLNELAQLIDMSGLLVLCDKSILENLHAHFLKMVESPQLIFSGREIKIWPHTT